MHFPYLMLYSDYQSPQNSQIFRRDLQSKICMGVVMKTISYLQGNGKVTIPVQIRKKYYLEEGDLLEVIELEDGVLLKPTKDISVQKLKEIDKKRKNELF